MNPILHATTEDLNAFQTRVPVWQRDPILFVEEVMRGPDFYQKQIAYLEELDKQGISEKVVRRAVGNFDVWMRTGLWEKQEELIRSVAENKKTACRSANGCGKTFALADIANWFLYCFSPSIVVTTAPTWRQVEKVLWGEIKSHHAKSFFPLGGSVLNTQIKIDDKWYAIGFSSTKESNFQGFREQHILFIVDEASGVKRETFQAISGSLSNDGARLIEVGNPVEDVGQFKDCFSLPSFNKIHMSALNSPNVRAGVDIIPGLTGKQWCDDSRKEWGEESAIWLARGEGEFPKEAVNTLIPLAWCERSVERWKDIQYQLDSKKIQFADLDLDGPVKLGVDVARKGENETVLTVRHGRRILKIVSYQGQRTPLCLKITKELMEEFGIKPVNVYYDCIGIGGPVSDFLYEEGLEVTEVEEIAANEPSRYVNRRSELAYRVREALRQDQLDLMPNDKLIFQTSHLYYDDPNGRILVMSKSLMKQKQLKSPDYFDSLALTYADEMPHRRAKAHLFYAEEFVESVHVQSFDQDKMRIGCTAYNVLIPNLHGASVLLWAVADKVGRIFFYRERVVPRSSGSAIEAAIREAEEEWETIYERYIPKIFTKEDERERFNLLEQLGESDLDFSEIEFADDIASMNIREGLRFDKTIPVGGKNIPFIFISPSCSRIVAVLKSFVDEKYSKNDDLSRSVHEAIGLMVLAEPEWVRK